MTTLESSTIPALPICDSTMASTTDALQSAVAAYGEWRREITRFVDLRMTRNRDSWDALLAAKDLASILKVQQEWHGQAATDYLNGSARAALLLVNFALTGTTSDIRRSTRLLA